MIEQTLESVKKRGGAGDALLRDQTTLSLKFESGRLKESALTQEAGLNLRVLADGRIGVAGTTELAALEDVVARAFASAAEGEPLDLVLPGRASVAATATYDERTAALDVSGLAALGRAVVERLQRPGWQVNASVDRTVETTTFANTAGQESSYRSTALGVSAEVTRIAGDDVLMAYDTVAGAGVPSEAELEAVARTITIKIERALTIVRPPEGKLPVLFTPEGSAAVLLPVRQALSGKSVLQGVSPLGGKLGEAVFGSAISITDDPLLPGRLGTRPVDDEGIPSARLALVERGVLRAFVYDLETAARAGARSTGHGQRSTFGKPGISLSNLVIEPGALDEAALLGEVGRGLVVEDLIGVGQGNVASGAFSHPVALAYRVAGGEITGRVKDAAVAGNAFQLLQRVRAIGRDAKWLGGSRLVPPLVVEGVNVARRA